MFGCIERIIIMKKDRVRISLDVSPELAEKLRAESDRKDITLNATIRLILQQYFEDRLVNPLKPILD